MSIAERRAAVRFLETYGVSVQRACVLVQLHRSTFGYQARPAVDDGVLQEIGDLALAHPRYGYRRIWAVIRRSRHINRKRVHRLWKQARLQVRRVKRRRTRPERPAVVAAAYPNHVWAYDFLDVNPRPIVPRHCRQYCTPIVGNTAHAELVSSDVRIPVILSSSFPSHLLSRG